MNRHIKKVVREPIEIIDFIVSYWPGTTGRILRAWSLAKKLRTIGVNPSIDIGVVITGGGRIRIGDYFSIMRYSALYAHDGEITIGNHVSINANVCIGAADNGQIVIGNDVLIAQNVVLRASDHEHGDIDIPIINQGHTGGKIIVEDDVWIGANVVVTRNTRIGSHSIVAAGSVVTRDVEPYSIVGGIPAMLIRKRIQKEG